MWKEICGLVLRKLIYDKLIPCSNKQCSQLSRTNSLEWCPLIKCFANIVYPPLPICTALKSYLEPWKRNVESNVWCRVLTYNTASTKAYEVLICELDQRAKRIEICLSPTKRQILICHHSFDQIYFQLASHISLKSCIMQVIEFEKCI